MANSDLYFHQVYTVQGDPKVLIHRPCQTPRPKCIRVESNRRNKTIGNSRQGVSEDEGRDSMDDFKIPKTPRTRLEVRQSSILENFKMKKPSYKKQQRKGRVSAQRRKAPLTGANRIKIKYNPVVKICRSRSRSPLSRELNPNPIPNAPVSGLSAKAAIQRKIDELERLGSSDPDPDSLSEIYRRSTEHIQPRGSDSSVISDEDLDRPSPEFYEALDREKEALGLETKVCVSKL